MCVYIPFLKPPPKGWLCRYALYFLSTHYLFVSNFSSFLLQAFSLITIVSLMSDKDNGLFFNCHFISFFSFFCRYGYHYLDFFRSHIFVRIKYIVHIVTKLGICFTWEICSVQFPKVVDEIFFCAFTFYVMSLHIFVPAPLVYRQSTQGSVVHISI